MHQFLVILLALSSTFAFAFLLTGFMSLIGPDEKELAEIRERDQAAQAERGRIAAFLEATALSRQYVDPVRHWRHRRDARRLLYVGITFSAVAAGIGYILGVFP
jgi:hypothetical protein